MELSGTVAPAHQRSQGSKRELLNRPHEDSEQVLRECVDRIRFWSMFAVVAMHSALIFTEVLHEKLQLVEIIQTPLKFASIAFFLMSGFLVGKSLDKTHPVAYLKRRIDRIFLPWLFWISMMIGGLVASKFLHHRVPFALNKEVLTFTEAIASYCLLNTAFWFVPNLLLSLALLLLCRRFIGSLRFGAVLLSFSLFYGVNIYKSWVPSLHTEALFGFVFYLWLGTYAARYQKEFVRWMGRVTSVQIFAALFITALLAYSEASYLDRLGVIDPMNSLRLSNQIFSVVAVLFLYKAGKASPSRFIDVRNTTFGIYLIHSLVLHVIWRCTNAHPLASAMKYLLQSDTGSVALWIVITFVAYGGSLLLTTLLGRRKSLAWLVGASRDAAFRPALVPLSSMV